MGENISSRVGRVLAGGFNKLIEAIENVAPETVLEQTIREIESAIEEVRTELGREVAGKHIATRRLFEMNKKHDELAEQLGVALGENRDDLAEAAIAKQLDIEAQVPVIEQTIHEIAEREKQLEGYLRALHGRAREMREEFISYRTQKESFTASPDSRGSSGSGASAVEARVQRAEAAFDRILERMTGIAGTGDVTEATSAAKLQELEQLARANRIKERLVASKVARSGDK